MYKTQVKDKRRGWEYIAYLLPNGNLHHIKAGCRYWHSFQEAEAHYSAENTNPFKTRPFHYRDRDSRRVYRWSNAWASDLGPNSIGREYYGSIRANALLTIAKLKIQAAKLSTKLRQQKVGRKARKRK